MKVANNVEVPFLPPFQLGYSHVWHPPPPPLPPLRSGRPIMREKRGGGTTTTWNGEKERKEGRSEEKGGFLTTTLPTHTLLIKVPVPPPFTSLHGILTDAHQMFTCGVRRAACDGVPRRRENPLLGVERVPLFCVGGHER